MTPEPLDGAPIFTYRDPWPKTSRTFAIACLTAARQELDEFVDDTGPIKVIAASDVDWVMSRLIKYQTELRNKTEVK